MTVRKQAKRTPCGRPKNWVRLECTMCERDDHDGITEKQLEACRQTWEGIREEQSWLEATTIWTEEQMKQDPWERTNLIWCTHNGTCPDCLAAMEREDAASTGQATLF